VLGEQAGLADVEQGSGGMRAAEAETTGDQDYATYP
jgi:hypothetical protein